jgi:hypothetical protein
MRISPNGRDRCLSGWCVRFASGSADASSWAVAGADGPDDTREHHELERSVAGNSHGHCASGATATGSSHKLARAGLPRSLRIRTQAARAVSGLHASGLDAHARPKQLPESRASSPAVARRSRRRRGRSGVRWRGCSNKRRHPSLSRSGPPGANPPGPLSLRATSSSERLVCMHANLHKQRACDPCGASALAIAQGRHSPRPCPRGHVSEAGCRPSSRVGFGRCEGFRATPRVRAAAGGSTSVAACRAIPERRSARH